MDTFQRLLPELIAQYGGTKQDLARAVGITPSTLSHLLTAGVPSTEVCLRLATATGASASKVLRAAGKGVIADLIEDLYGASAARRQAFTGIRPTPHEQKHLEALRTLAPKAQRAFFVIVDAAAARRPGRALMFLRAPEADEAEG